MWKGVRVKWNACEQEGNARGKECMREGMHAERNACGQECMQEGMLAERKWTHVERECIWSWIVNAYLDAHTARMFAWARL